MLPSGHGGQDWTGRLVGLVLTLLVISTALQVLVEMIRPLVPWLGLSLIVFAGVTAWRRSHDW